MNLVLTGPSGSGKTHRILAEFREAVKARRSDIRLVVPTATLVQHLRHELAREGLVFNPRCILTLSAFTTEICGDLPTADDTTLTLAAELAVRAVNAREFQRVSRLPGFHAALVHILSELDSAGCTPDQFSRIPLDTPLAHPLLAVWRHIERQLTRRGLFTRSHILHRAAEEIRSRFDSLRVHTIWFDGFVGFARPELQLIETVSSITANALAANLDITVALPSFSTAIPALADLRAAGFDFEELSNTPDPDSDTPFEVAYFQAENAEREADEIARRIVLYSQSGREFRDIAVVLRTAEDTAPLLATTFQRYGIPARFYFSGALTDHPIAGFALRFVEALLSGWDLEATLAVLRLTPGLAPSASLDRWDVAIRENIPGRGLDLLRDNGVWITDRFAEFDSWRVARWSPERWADVLAEIPARVPPPRPGTNPEAGTPANALLQRGQAAATQAWTTAMQETAAWLVRDPDAQQNFISLEDFWQVAKSIVRLAPLSIADSRRNVVHIMSVFEARQWDPAIMFIPNLTEKVFPRYHSQDPFLPDSAIRELKAAGIRLRDSRDRDAEESCLFDAIAQRPLGRGQKRREVCLSYSRRNNRGEENVRSSFFGRLRAVETKALLSRPAPIISPVLPRTATRIRSGDLLTDLANRHLHFSPSSLEMYARCPFQFYAGRTLRLQSLPDTPEERLSFLVQGTIVHDVLKQWTPHRGPVRPFFDSAFTAICQREHIQQTYRTEVLRQRMLSDLEKFCEYFKTFGSGDPLTEQSFDFQILPNIQLRGRIDRIDQLNEAVVIVDYKYSNNTKQNVDDETKLQGVLYTLAAERHFGMKPRATVFVGVKGCQKPVGWGDLPGVELQELTAEWLEKGLSTVSRIVQEIRDGLIHANPSNLRHCEYCDFRDTCRYEVTEAARGAQPGA